MNGFTILLKKVQTPDYKFLWLNNTKFEVI